MLHSHRESLDLTALGCLYWFSLYIHLSLFLNVRPSSSSLSPSLTKSVLEQLVSEYHRLNEALRAEKRLYQSLTHIHTKGDR